MITTISFLFFSIMALFLTQSLVSGNIQTLNAFLLSIVAFSGMFLLIQVRKEWACIKCKLKQNIILINRSNLLTILALSIGAYLTFYLNHAIGLGGVLASSVVGLIAAWTFKPYAAAIYCGSFIGMACSLIFSNPLSLLVASLISGTLYILSLHLFSGFGGKLGFMAFSGTFLTSLIFRTPLRTVDPLDRKLYLVVFLSIIAAGMATYALQRIVDMDAVSASALVGLTLALLYPDSTHVVVVAAFCATFTGMVSYNRVKTYNDMLFLTILTGVLFIAAFALFDGSGGKLGATAFLSTVSGVGMLDFIRLIRRHFHATQQSSYSS
ncbi:hypothetical protein [Alkalibacterium olivapovliticus]|uniref:Uncharacterized protein n=1 Tax=Alkalibacterium olivapovliticus TaxID=99907 RepID=A0A2T0WC43_9LACT|nr:hypothetical protein [Alkalibacterium olivapovliticus]PRY84206.1 hypothetical protein CLV38_101127 [Alkalibacterium olivapovliticus]